MDYGRLDTLLSQELLQNGTVVYDGPRNLVKLHAHGDAFDIH